MLELPVYFSARLINIARPQANATPWPTDQFSFAAS
jgi:hypothetical protein